MTICRSKAILLASLVALTGCLDTKEMSFAPLGGAKPPASAQALSQAPLANGNVVLKAPEGWCIEPRSLRNNARRSFALLASCHDMTNGKVGSPSPAGYISVSVGAPMNQLDETGALLDAVLAGQAPKARSDQEGISKAQLAIPEAEAAPAWRVALIRAGRPVLVSVFASSDSALAGPFGGRMADTVAKSLEIPAAPQEVAQK